MNFANLLALEKAIQFLWGILGLLIVFTVGGVILKRIKPSLPLSDYFARLFSWWIVTAVLGFILILPREWGAVLFSVLIYFALAEGLSHMYQRKQVILLCSAGMWIGLLTGLYLVSINPLYIYALLILGPCYAFATFLRSKEHDEALWCRCILLPHILISLSSLTFLLCLGTEKSRTVFILTVLITQFNDINQYFAGKLFGKTPLVPQLSPKKTREGFVGGFLSTILICVFLLPLALDISITSSIFIGGLLSILGLGGDLLFSSAKRSLKIKDFGTLLPGQGGLLDRLDSLTLTAPAATLLYILSVLHLP